MTTSALARIDRGRVNPTGSLYDRILMAGAVAKLDFASLLLDQLTDLPAHFREDELAFLALTSKVELPIRDALAYALFRELPKDEFLVAREWKRVDLAVLSREADPVPRMLLEAKALYTFDLVGVSESWIGRYPEKVQRDLEKLRAIENLPSAAQLFALVLVTHPTAPIDPELKQVAKYWSGISKAVRELRNPGAVEQDATRNLESLLGEMGHVERGKIRAGQAYRVPLEVHYWLVGPIDHGAS